MRFEEVFKIMDVHDINSTQSWKLARIINLLNIFKIFFVNQSNPSITPTSVATHKICVFTLKIFTCYETEVKSYI